ncbi:hypothetical protein BVY00_01460 [bacterium G20]|nr:hypothetical protein BVY00_01460 [bacterium G20]
MRPTPLVSVIMPAWNNEAYIEAAVNSLIDQTYKDWELVVVNDYSNDKTGKVIDSLAKKDKRIRAFHNKQNIKQTRTRNFAISQAKGEYIALLDSDDERPPTSLEKQVKFLEANPDVVAVGTGAEICDIHMNRLNDRLYPLENEQIRRTFFRYSPFCLASLMIRAKALDSPAYNPDVEPAEDIDLAMRLGMKGKLANLPEILYRVRTHKQSVTQRGARVMEKKTFGIRRKAVKQYGYKMTLADMIYNILQFSSMYLMPPRFRFWLFNKIRSSK